MNKKFVKGANYSCYDCAKPLIPHCGGHNEWHFKHKANYSCALSQKSSSPNSMSAFHKNLQMAFFFLGATIEKRFDKNIADVYYNNRVIEIQYSPISTFKIIERSQNYQKMTGKYPIWILNEATQNSNNYPKYLLKIIVGKQQIQVCYQDTSILLKDYFPVKKAVQLCEHLSEIQGLLHQALEPLMPELQALYQVVTNKKTAQIRYYQSFKKLQKAEDILSRNPFSDGQKTQLEPYRQECRKTLQKYILQQAFLKEGNQRQLFTRYALTFFDVEQCQLLKTLEYTGPKYKNQPIDTVDNFYVLTTISRYFGKLNIDNKKQRYYNCFFYTVLTRNLEQK